MQRVLYRSNCECKGRRLGEIMIHSQYATHKRDVIFFREGGDGYEREDKSPGWV